jgi:NitT/TauT family transport system substrate-binding protein
MHMLRRLLRLGLVGLVGFAGCGPAPAAPTTAPATPATASTATGAYTTTPLNPRMPVVVMDNQVTSMVPVYLAYDRGFFSQEGLDVDLQVLNDNAAIIQTLATNQSQFAVTTPDPIIFNAIGRGIDIKIVAPSTVNGPTDRPAQFVVRKDLIDSGAYKSPADLRGLTVAAPAQSSEMYVERTLAQGGLTLKDVNVTVIRTPDMLAGFQSKAIDAAWLPEPVATAVNAGGFGKTVASTGELFPGAVAAALLMSPQFFKDHPDAAQRFVTAYVRGARAYYQDLMKKGDTAAVVKSFVTHTTIQDAALYDRIGLPSVDPNTLTDPAQSWSVFQDFFVRQGLQEQKIDLTSYVDFSLVNSALEKLGRV